MKIATNLIQAITAANQRNPSGRDYVCHPVRYVGSLISWTTEEQRSHLDWSNVVREAEGHAERLNEFYDDSGCGFGSSDWTYEMKSFLEAIGYEVGFVDGSAKVLGLAPQTSAMEA